MYTDYFGFSEKPFNITPDPKYLYLSASHQETLAAMLYGIHEKRGFISIIGEVGTGKTTLLRFLLNELDKDTETILIFNTNVTFEQLLKNILWELNISTKNESKPEMIQLLNQFLINKLANGENTALIIDEAQNLSPEVLEELRMLSNLETNREKLLQILLIGQPELLTKLNLPNLRQLKQRIAINCFLTSLSYEDSMKYILHRLSVAGYDKNHLFSKESLDLICKHSQGIPRVINIVCDNALLSGYGKHQRTINIDIAEDVIEDYEMRQLPTNEIEKFSATSDNMSEPASMVPSSKSSKGFQRFAQSRSIIILLAFTIVVLSLLGISVYGKSFYSFNQFMGTILNNLSSPWLKNEHSLSDSLVADSLQDISGLSEYTDNEVSNGNASLTLTSKDTFNEQPVMENLSPTAPASSSFEDTSAPSDASPLERYHKEVSAKRGDRISTLVLREYGTINDTILDMVKRANPEIKNLDRIDIGQTILLPALDLDNTIVKIGEGVFAVHIASFNSYDNAIQYSYETLGKKYPIIISSVQVAGKDPWYRVLLGNFAEREQALMVAKNINFENVPLTKK